MASHARAGQFVNRGRMLSMKLETSGVQIEFAPGELNEETLKLTMELLKRVMQYEEHILRLRKDLAEETEDEQDDEA